MTSRLAALGLLTGLLIGLCLVVPPASQAAWGTQHTFHGAKLQLCKTRSEGSSRYDVLRMRLDNRGARHVHHGSIGRNRNGRYTGVMVRAAAGRMSSVKSITFRSTDELIWGGGEGEGINFGDTVRLRDVRVC